MIQAKALILFIVLLNLTYATISCSNTQCNCYWNGLVLAANCSGAQFTEFPSELFDPDISQLDLSRNKFTTIPSSLNRFSSLEQLYINENLISKLDKFSLAGLNNLQYLHMKKNSIINLQSIQPADLLKMTPKILTLNLNENPITNLDETAILESESLQRLYLAKCKISRISSQSILKGLPNLEYLNLENNPLQYVPDLISSSLLSLDLSNTNLGILQNTIFEQLPKLQSVDLSRNHRISLKSNNYYVTSNSLRRISLAYCNMNEIELQEFKFLTTAVLKGNMIREITQKSFANNSNLEYIDLSYNAITLVTADAFKHLKKLKHLDLSFNMISRIERDTFKWNDVLSTIYLRRNYISRFSKFYCNSLGTLDLSGNEIMSIDPDALNGFLELNELNLSNNLLSIFPEMLKSTSLQILDLSMCRITSIRNGTFHGFPEITKISLAGNRLTKTPQRDFFANNIYIQELFLSDNPWRCDCSDNEFYEFYNHFTNPYKKIIDIDKTKCMAPEEYYGKLWLSSCWYNWYPEVHDLSLTEKIWTFFMVSIIVFAGSVCIVMSIRKCIEGRELTRQEEERRDYLEEQRRIRRENIMIIQESGQLNAPNPRESRPPCYEDAILLPRVAVSSASLDELSTRRKRTKSKTEDVNIDNENNHETLTLSQRCRCRSEEVLSMREVVRNSESNQLRSEALVRNIEVRQALPDSEIRPNGGILRQSDNTSTHYHVTDILDINQRNSIENYPIPTPPSSPPPSISYEITPKSTSPYSQRRLKPKNSFSSYDSITPYPVDSIINNNQPTNSNSINTEAQVNNPKILKSEISVHMESDL